MCSLLFKKKKTHRAKHLTQKETMSQIEALSQGETESYRLTEANGNKLAVVEFNAEYPWGGNKFILNTQSTVNAKLTVEREQMLVTDDVKEVASWLIKHRAKRRLNRRIISSDKAI